MLSVAVTVPLVAILGAILGSFLNVLIVRTHDRVSILGRSACPHCKSVIRPRHLVPILSWCFLRGKCASCVRPIHLQYPLVELAFAALLVVAYLRHPFLSSSFGIEPFLFEALVSSLLLFLIVFDLRWKLLPIEIMGASAVVFALWNLFLHDVSLQHMMFAICVGSGFFLIQVILSGGRWMGEGDPWLGGLIGAILGWPTILAGLYLAYIVGGVAISVAWLIGWVRRGDRIPFAPVLGVGTWLAIWFGKGLWTYVFGA